MKCARCQIDTPPGCVHVGPDSCIDALIHELEKSKKCASCSGTVETVIHPACVPAEVVNRGAKLGTAAIETKIKEWLARKISGQPNDPNEGRNPDDGPPRKRWKG